MALLTRLIILKNTTPYVGQLHAPVFREKKEILITITPQKIPKSNLGQKGTRSRKGQGQGQGKRHAQRQG